jgi:hypothetical protein
VALCVHQSDVVLIRALQILCPWLVCYRSGRLQAFAEHPVPPAPLGSLCTLNTHILVGVSQILCPCRCAIMQAAFRPLQSAICSQPPLAHALHEVISTGAVSNEAELQAYMACRCGSCNRFLKVSMWCSHACHARVPGHMRYKICCSDVHSANVVLHFADIVPKKPLSWKAGEPSCMVCYLHCPAVCWRPSSPQL